MSTDNLGPLPNIYPDAKEREQLSYGHDLLCHFADLV